MIFGGQCQRSTALAILAILLATVSIAYPFALEDDSGAERATGMANGNDALVAIITPLNDIVSNGTWVWLNSSDSYIPAGLTLLSTTWEVTHENITKETSARNFEYLFSDLGLYKIKLTTMDSSGNVSVDFTAVISVADADFDELQDWWEMFYFDSLDPVPSGDSDQDGLTNLQEYALGSSPIVYDAPEETATSGLLETYWQYLIVAAAVVAVVLALVLSRQRKKRKELEKKKIQLAIDIERSLGED